MAFIWIEAQHEEQGLNAANDPSTIQTLKKYGFLKFFWLLGMRQQMELLEFLVHSWDVQAWALRLGEHLLKIKV